MSLFTGAIALSTALAAAGTKGAFDAVGASKAANASEYGAQLQAQATQNALDFTKAQKAKQEAAYAPYGAIGQQAVSALPGAIRPNPTQGPPPTYSGPPPLAYMGQGGQPGPATYQPPSNAPLSQIGAPQQASGPMVTLQAPDGSQKQVPQSQAQFYIAKGARQIGV